VSQEWCNARLPEGHGAQHGSKTAIVSIYAKRDSDLITRAAGH
jgi:hypothetical protein